MPIGLKKGLKKQNPQFCNRVMETEDSRGWKKNYWDKIDKKFVWFNTVFVNATKKNMAEVLKYPLTPVPLY